MATQGGAGQSDGAVGARAAHVAVPTVDVDGVHPADDALVATPQALAVGPAAGAPADADLTSEDGERAVAAHRQGPPRPATGGGPAPFSARSEAEVRQRVLGDRRHGL